MWGVCYVQRVLYSGSATSRVVSCDMYNTVQWECNIGGGYAMYSVYCTVVVQQAVLCAVLCTILYSGSSTYVGGYAMYSVYCTVVVQQEVLCAVLCTILYSGSATYVGGM